MSNDPATRDEGFYWIVKSEGCDPEVALWSAKSRQWLLIGDSYHAPTDIFKVGPRVYPPKTLTMTPERLAEYTRRPADGSFSEQEGDWYR